YPSAQASEVSSSNGYDGQLIPPGIPLGAGSFPPCLFAGRVFAASRDAARARGLRSPFCALLAQLAEASSLGGEGSRFESGEGHSIVIVNPARNRLAM